jgi:hypothetical protein
MVEAKRKDMRHVKTTRSLLLAANLLLLVLPLLMATPSRALAYADPGTGAFIYQAVYAAFLGGTFYLRKFLNRFWPRRDK